MQSKVAILNLEASTIYEHMTRGKLICDQYSGLLPMSLTLNKLTDIGLSIQLNKSIRKICTPDVVNVKFRSGVKSYAEIIKLLTAKSNEATDEDEKVKISQKMTKLEPDWKTISRDDLRKDFYSKGFTIDHVNKVTGEIRTIEYEVFQRSSSKSRTGEVLFINKKMAGEIKTWARMGLDFNDGNTHDMASLLSYESLTSSSIEDSVIIPTKNILLISDVYSVFSQECNVVRTNPDTDRLDSFREIADVKNSLFDGQSMMDKSLFKDNKGMKLLRNHMFKSAGMRCDVQQYLMDSCPSEHDFDSWVIKDLFGNNIMAKDVLLITTSSSLKALKFSHLIGTEAKMYEYWKQMVEADGCLFGICKSEKQSKRGRDSKGNALQQMSYQMLNTVPMSSEEVAKIARFEMDYIESIKNDSNNMMKHFKYRASYNNSYNMWADLVARNPKVADTILFKKAKAQELYQYKTHIKRGKIRLEGDYYTVVGNGLEMLLHAIGKLPINEKGILDSGYTGDLMGNQISASTFSEGVELVGFRNPHTSPNNIVVQQNVKVDAINKYFGLLENMVMVNAIKFEIQDRYSSMDMDSDNIALFNNPDLLRIVKEKVWGKYLVVLNHVKSEGKKYLVNNESMYLIDKQLAKSQMDIGLCVNTGQEIMSTYWDELTNGVDNDILELLMKMLDVATVLSCICIDLAKKLYEIDLGVELISLSNSKLLGEKLPLFFTNVKKPRNRNDREKLKTKMRNFNTPMDYLYHLVDDIKKADGSVGTKLKPLLIKESMTAANRRTSKKVIEDITDMTCELNRLNQMSAETDDDDARYRQIEAVQSKYEMLVGKYTIDSETMYHILCKTLDNESKIASNVLGVLHRVHHKVFLESFVSSEDIGRVA